MFIIDLPRARRAAVALTAAVGLALPAGCGGDQTESSPGKTGTTGVASIQKPSASPARAAAAAERPVIRLDSTEADKTRMQDVYIDCLLSRGFPEQGLKKGSNGGYPSDIEDFDLAPEVVA